MAESDKALGAHEKAREQLETAAKIAREAAYDEGLDVIELGLAGVALEEGRADEAANRCERLLRQAVSLGGSHEDLLVCQETACEAAIARGDIEEARRLAERYLAFAGEDALPDCRLFGSLVLARTDEPGSARRAKLLDRARALYEDCAGTLTAWQHMSMALSLGELTGERRYLDEARARLEAVLAANPPRLHDAMLERVALYRRILAATD
jgi:tetratricopeptide (TPR) repeat protein